MARAQKTRTEVRQEQIAEAALMLIGAHGFHRLSVASLAKKVGVVPSAIYRHYAGKQEVLDAVLELISKRLLQNVQLARRTGLNSLKRLYVLLMSHVQLVQNDIPIPRVVFSEEIFTGHKKHRHRVHEIFREYLGQVAELIREGQRVGEIKGGFDADTLALMYLGLVQPSAILWLMSEDEFDFAQHVKNAWAVFSQLIQTDKK